MKIAPTTIDGVCRVHGDVFGDQRGFVTEVFRDTQRAQIGIARPFVQANHARSVRGTVRGMHWQDPRPQGKLVSVLQGAIYDVVLDVRVGSPTFGHHVGVELVAGTGDQLWVAEGLAHGFCALTETADVLYLCTDVYEPDGQRGVRWDDPSLGIVWPARSPVVSEKDRGLPTLAEIGRDALPRWTA